MAEKPLGAYARRQARIAEAMALNLAPKAAVEGTAANGEVPAETNPAETPTVIVHKSQGGSKAPVSPAGPTRPVPSLKPSEGDGANGGSV